MTDFSRPLGKNTRIDRISANEDASKWDPYRSQPDPFTSWMPYNNPNKATYRDNKVYARSRQ